MFGLKQRFWFLARRTDRGGVFYLIAATSLKKARRTLGFSASLYNVKAIDWRCLTRLMKCLKPAGAMDADKAKGDLLINVEDVVLIVRAAD